MTLKDKESQSALIRLLDALCKYERNSGRRSTLILIPHNFDEEIVIAQDGKPQPNLSIDLAIKLAFSDRDKS
jgi:hypothetical protein